MKCCNLFAAWMGMKIGKGVAATPLLGPPILHNIFVPLGLLTLLSCSQKYLVHRGSGGEVVARHLRAVCLTGEGRGRVHWNRQKYSFSYESLLGDRSWKLALNFPFRQTLLLELRERGRGGGVELAGGGIDHLQQALQLSPRQRRRVSKMLQQLGQWVRVARQAQRVEGLSEGSCTWQVRGEKLLCGEGRKRFGVTLGRRDVTLQTRGLRATLSRFRDQYFQRIFLRSPSGPGVEFFLGSCQGRQ